MNNELETEQTGLHHAAHANGTSPSVAAFARGQSSPVLEPTHRAEADKARGIHSSPSETGVEACHLLNQSLTNCVDLRLQCKQAQWNLSGHNVDALVALFAQTASAIEQYSNRLAARITALGAVADGTLDTVAEHSGLNMYPCPVTRDRQHVDAVVSALAVTVVSLRSELAVLDGRCDGQTSNLLEQLALDLESHSAAIEAQRQAIATIQARPVSSQSARH